MEMLRQNLVFLMMRYFNIGIVQLLLLFKNHY